jgi:hypothetical protein
MPPINTPRGRAAARTSAALGAAALVVLIAGALAGQALLVGFRQTRFDQGASVEDRSGLRRTGIDRPTTKSVSRLVCKVSGIDLSWTNSPGALCPMGCGKSPNR